MKSRKALLEEIVASISDGEWAALESDTCPLPVNAFNRATLLRLRKYEPESDVIEEARIEGLRSQLESFLDEHLADNPGAHRFIVASCLGLAFVLHEPMHPIDRVGIRLSVHEGETQYYCPSREPGTLCDSCVCLPSEP